MESHRKGSDEAIQTTRHLVLPVEHERSGPNNVYSARARVC